EETQVAVSTDALRTTRPIRTNVETPDQINEVFDGIAYQKTASVLRTIENYVGPDLFRKGVASYLRKYSFASAAGPDFCTEAARGSLAASERLSLLGDEWWMVRAGRHDIGVYLDLASALASDEVPSVAEQIGHSLAYTREDVVQPDDTPRFEEWVRRRFGPDLTTLG